jgi:D-3-phosphoglycerate dehydrogenase
MTDRAWPDDSVEREVIEAAGFRFVTGPPEAPSTLEVERAVTRHQPAAVMTCWAQVSATAMTLSTPLQLVARMGVGLDNIAVDYATGHGILVTNVPDYCVEEVSDHAVGFALAWTRGLIHFEREVRAGRWDPSSAKLRRLSALTCGVVGFGRIGRRTATKLRALGATVVASEPFPPADTEGIKVVPLPDLLVASDIVIIHAPLTETTRHLIGEPELALMPPGGLLINVSRGPLVDTDAVIAALNSGHLGAAGLDVLQSEPEVPAGLLAHPNAMITPHVAFSSDVAVEQLRRTAAEEVVRVLSGQPPRYACNRPAARTGDGPRPSA